ncbi:MAG: hypothetical protein ACTSWN_08445 [Promethearchaeota archaeon]
MFEEFEKKLGGFEKEEDYVIWVICPKCKKTGQVKVDRELLKELFKKGRGRLIDFPVVAGTVCEHDFIVHLDGNLQVR